MGSSCFPIIFYKKKNISYNRIRNCWNVLHNLRGGNMARKGNIVADIKKENPLLTIVKAGKIPVVRLATTGFQNFIQKNYFTNYRDGEYADTVCEETRKGCFVSLAGVQGNYVCGAHYGESIHIGYLEPDDIVFSTHVLSGKNGYYCEQTAKERFEYIQETYKIFQKGVKEENWDPDDFDLYSEAIVDSKKVRKVMVIQPNEYHLLLPYCNDGLFRIFDVSNIFYHMVWDRTLSEEFASYMGWRLDDCHHFYYNDMEVYSLMENPYYKDSIFKELVYFYATGSFLHEKSYYDGLQSAMCNYCNKFWEKYGSMYYGKESVFRYFDNEKLHFHYEKDTWKEQYTISAFSNNDEVSLSILKSRRYEQKKEYEYFKFTEKNIISQKYRHILYNLIEMKELFDECIGKYIHIENPKWMHVLNTFRKLEQRIGEWGLVYFYDEVNHELTFNLDNFNFVYNLVLLDGVVETKVEDENGNCFYNLDNLPLGFNRFWLDIILEILTLWESLFIKKTREKIFSLIFFIYIFFPLYQVLPSTFSPFHHLAYANQLLEKAKCYQLLHHQAYSFS